MWIVIKLRGSFQCLLFPRSLSVKHPTFSQLLVISNSELTGGLNGLLQQHNTTMMCCVKKNLFLLAPQNSMSYINSTKHLSLQATLIRLRHALCYALVIISKCHNKTTQCQSHESSYSGEAAFGSNTFLKHKTTQIHFRINFVL